MAKRPLKALFFDIDDTVYSTTEFATAARKNAVQAMVKAGLRMDEEECLRELTEVIEEFGSNHPGHFDKLFQRIPPDLYGDIPPVILVAAGMVAYHQTKFRHFAPYEDAIEVIRRLGERKLRLGIVTQGVGVKQAEKIVRLGLHLMVDPRFILISDVLGISKRNPKIYRRACDLAGAEPAACAYVGDNPHVDVDVPHELGMRTFLSRRSGKYAWAEGSAAPDHVVHNFWDVLELIDAEYEIQPIE